ncbi:MAG: glycosyltransferase, partial [Acidobacteria bacterium]|nr:glycosyltransferase [Acidobacteriota bacterium]
RCIEALRASQGRELFEILVVDLGSRDGSPQLDAEFEDITMLRLPKHFGATKAMNIATRTAMGDYILYLDPHVELKPDALVRLMRHLDTDEDASAVCPLLEDAATGKPVPQAYRLPDRELLLQACKTGIIPLAAVNVGDGGSPVPVAYHSRAALMVRKQFVQGMNYFDERYGHYWGDAELAWQIRKAGKKTLILPQAHAIWHTPADVKSKALEADRWVGAAAFVGKHDGFGAGIGFLVAAAFRALFSFDFGLLSALVTNRKIDGTQGPV